MLFCLLSRNSKKKYISEKCAPAPVIFPICYSLGNVLELPPALWEILSDHINEWFKEFFSDQPGASSQDFYRCCNARLKRKILEVTGVKEDINIDTQQSEIDPQKMKVASEIDIFVKKFKKK